MSNKDSISGGSEDKVIRVPIGSVITGMMTARDVYSRNDQLILSCNTVLDAGMIAKLIFYAIESIAVYEVNREENKETIFSNKIKKSLEFREFKKSYDIAVEDGKVIMNDLIECRGKKNTSVLIRNIQDIISNCSSNTNVFQMLHCIRDYDDPTYMHSINVGIICHVFAEWLHMTEEEKEILTLSGMLHDIGKIKIPKAIINKPEKLTPEEYEVIKTHPVIGYQILSNNDMDDRVRMAALSHHERYDGKGYPDGLVGNEINYFPMIVAIADVYEAMTSNRIYRPAVCPFDVIHQLEQEGLQQYAPQYLIPLLERIVETYIHQTVRLSNDMMGEIIMVNQHALSKPIIKVKSDLLDLSIHRSIKIDAVL